MATAPISVIMPVLNEAGHLADAVASVMAQNYDGDFELLLALGPSTDGTNQIAAELAAADSRIRLIDNPRGLTTVGLNEAIRQSKHDIIIRIDAHSEPAEGYFANGVRILLMQKADLLGGIMDARGRSAFQKATAWAYTSRFGIGGANFHVGGEAGEAESAYLGIFKKSALTRVGGYDEIIIRGEDWELAQRIKATGGLVWFSPELRVVYWPRGRFDRLVKQFYSTGVWRGDLTKRDLKNAPKRYFAPPLLVAAVVAGLWMVLAGWYIGILPLAAYLMGAAGLAATARGLSLKARIALLIVLPTIHFSWGWGFWVGFFKGAGQTIDKSRVNK
ncbi:glycosyltransferase family 2 protein [Rhodoluna limnophila]|uniref:glycosyltransferase family 2 protein n=1 Tax=Rhodoluna limnophila TaxID=232537 RepID=UPI001FEE2CCF|nr:glycosyltransferase family 2 protein [Rhodoluna limnophila]